MILLFGVIIDWNRTIIDWNQLPAGLLAPFPCNLSTFRKRPKKVVATKEPK
jgi:hypothetical protein